MVVLYVPSLLLIISMVYIDIAPVESKYGLSAKEKIQTTLRRVYNEDGVGELLQLSEQIKDPKEIPLYEFGFDLERILIDWHDDPKLVHYAEFVFQEYMIKLRNYYLRSFSRTVAALPAMGKNQTKEYLLHQKQVMLTECKDVMEGAVPIHEFKNIGIFRTEYLRFFTEVETSISSLIDEVVLYFKVCISMIILVPWLDHSLLCWVSFIIDGSFY